MSLRASPGRSGELWAVAAYFDPVGYRRKLANFRAFRRHLTVPLVAMEVAPAGRFRLGPGDADVLVQLPGEDALWQKERLLNLAWPHVPPECRKIAWLDADLVFARPDWAEHASRLLEVYPLVQPFSSVCDLERDEDPDRPPEGKPPTGRSVAAVLASGVPPAEILRLPMPRRRAYGLGVAWAARRDVLERHGLYDACIVGGGDRAIAAAALGHFDGAIGPLCFNERQARHYLAWAEPFFRAVGGRVGGVEGTVYHAWHGEWPNRAYRQRTEGLRAYGFDPHVDIAPGARGCWRWSSAKPELHAYVRGYFERRREDGDAA